MRSHWLLLPLFGALVGSAGADLPKRQNDDDTTTSAGGSEPTTTGGSGGNPPPETTTSEEPAPTTTGGGGGGGDDNSDTTTTVTTTVGGGGGGSTETTRTTVSVTSPTVVVIVETAFETTTVTEQNGDGTATRTIYETTTVMGNNERRAVEDGPQTVAEAEAVPTDDAPAPTAVDAYMEMMKREPAPGHLAKRDTITVTETVSRGGGGDGETVTDTFTRTVFDTSTTRTTTTNFITETDEVGATTTETVTSTLTVTSSSVTTGVTEPTDGAGDGGDGGNGGGDDEGGLSTGAKAGIGAGVGVAGLLVLAGLGWFCFKKRRSGPKPDHDDMFGASEVPVGAAAGGAGGAAAGAAAGRRTPTMSHSHSTSTGGGGLTPSAAATKPYAAEGYRGTAMGDGRAGYAKPEPYGAAYTRASGISRSPVSGMTGYSRPTEPSSTMTSGDRGDVLPEHSTPAEMESVSSPQTAELGTGGTAARWENSNAAEIDGQPALNTQSGPVYEMPAQPYR